MLTQYQENLLKDLTLNQKIEMIKNWVASYKDILKITDGNKRSDYLQKIDSLNLYLYQLENPADKKVYITQREIGGLRQGLIFVCDKQLQRIKNTITELNKEKSELQKQIGLYYYTKRNKKKASKNKNNKNIDEIEARLETVKEIITELTRQQQEMEHHMKMKKAI